MWILLVSCVNSSSVFSTFFLFPVLYWCREVGRVADIHHYIGGGWWWGAYVAAKKLQKKKYFFLTLWIEWKHLLCWCYSSRHQAQCSESGLTQADPPLVPGQHPYYRNRACESSSLSVCLFYLLYCHYFFALAHAERFNVLSLFLFLLLLIRPSCSDSLAPLCLAGGAVIVKNVPRQRFFPLTGLRIRAIFHIVMTCSGMELAPPCQLPAVHWLSHRPLDQSPPGD